MNSRHTALVRILGFVLLGIFLWAGCAWDLGQAVFHPSTEQRVRESLSGDLGVPAPVSAGPDSFCFAMFGDPQIRSDHRHLFDRFKQDVESRGMDFFAVLGDLTHDATADEVEVLKGLLEGVGIPYYVTIGNHDLYQRDGWVRYKDNFGPSCYSVVIADAVKIILLDTAGGTIGETQFDWLERELDDGGRHVKVVGTHFPCYAGSVPLMGRMASGAERYKLQHLLQEHDVYAYVSGHIHAWRHTAIGGVHHFIVGTMNPYGLDYGKEGYLLFSFACGSLSWEHVEF